MKRRTSFLASAALAVAVFAAACAPAAPAPTAAPTAAPKPAATTAPAAAPAPAASPAAVSASPAAAASPVAASPVAASPVTAPASGSAAAGGPPSGEPVVIGVLLDSSGGASLYSKETTKGIDYAADELNKQGGILGRPVKIVKQDDGNDSNVAQLRVRSLLDSGAVAVALTSGSASTLQAKAVLAEKQVPGVAPTNLNDAITKAPNETYVFAITNSTSQIVSFLSQKMSQYKRVAIFTDTSATGTGLAKSYADAFQKAGLNVVGTEAVDPGATDATPQVARIKDMNPDVVFISGQSAPEQLLYLRTAVGQGLTIPAYQDTTGSLPAYQQLVGPEGLKYLRYVDNLDPTNTAAMDLQKKFAAAYPDQPFLGVTAQGYDTIYMFKAAIEATKATTGPAIKDALEQLSLPAHFGQPGYKIVCAKDNHLCTSDQGLVLLGFQNGQPTPIK